MSDGSEQRLHSADSVLPETKPAAAPLPGQAKAKSEGAPVVAPGAAATAPDGPGHIDGF